MTSETWRERLAEWQGEMNVTVRELNKNQDELDETIKTLWGMHSGCREEVLKAITNLQADARHVGKIRGILIGVLGTIGGGIILAIILRAAGL